MIKRAETIKYAKIRDALQVIQLQAEALRLDLRDNALYKLDLIVEQVKKAKRIIESKEKKQ